MGRPLFLLVPGALLHLCLFHVEGYVRGSTFCTSCDEFVDKICRKNLGSCSSKYPDFACQTKEVYSHQYTGAYVYQYSILRCPKRCVEYVLITKREKTVIHCCNQSYCNDLSVQDTVPFYATHTMDLA